MGAVFHQFEIFEDDIYKGLHAFLGFHELTICFRDEITVR